MATVGRVEAIWQNFIGAPGYSRFTFEAPVTPADATTITGKVRAFFNSLTGILPTGLTVQVQQAVPLYDEQTGILMGEISATTAPAVVTGAATSTGAYAGGAGAWVGWKTSSIWQGRRVQGRTFLVPLQGVSEAANGTLTSAALTTIATAADGMISPSTPAFGMWAKRFDRSSGSAVQVDGSFFLVTAHSTPDKTGILKSRRD